MTRYADVIFTGGPVYWADSSGRRVAAATVPGGRPVTAAATAISELSGRRPGWSTCAAAHCCPASRTPSCTRRSLA